VPKAIVEAQALLGRTRALSAALAARGITLTVPAAPARAGTAEGGGR
jgi:hypothetical protein